MKISVMILLCFMSLVAHAQVPQRVPEYGQNMEKTFQYFLVQLDKFLPPQRKKKDDRKRKRSQA